MAARFAAGEELWHPADATFDGWNASELNLGCGKKSELGGVRKLKNKFGARANGKWLGMFKTVADAAAAVRKFKAEQERKKKR